MIGQWKAVAETQQATKTTRLNLGEIGLFVRFRNLWNGATSIIFAQAAKHEGQCLLLAQSGHPMPGTNHYDIVFGLANRESPLAKAVLETMGLP